MTSKSKLIQKTILYVSLLRAKQWHKNGFVLLGFFVLGDYQNQALLVLSTVAAIAFALAASAVYIFNDYCDREADRFHMLKKQRPLAAGTIGTPGALALAVLLSAAAMFLAVQVSYLAALLLAAYLLNNLTYSLWLKQIPIIDIFQIAFGFILRILTGTIGIGINISEWMLLTGFMVSILIGFSKRYSELSQHDEADNQRTVLQHYSVYSLRVYIIIMATATIMTYSMYTLSPRSVALHGHTNLIYTIPIVIFGIFRFLHLVLDNRQGEDPANLILQDRQVVLAVLIWIVTYGFLIFKV